MFEQYVSSAVVRKASLKQTMPPRDESEVPIVDDPSSPEEKLAVEKGDRTGE